jgi:hypothetical protein
MGIVRKILGEEKPTKEDLLTIRESVEEEISGGKKTMRKADTGEEELTTDKLVPRGIEMFVRLSDYNKIVSQLNRLEAVIERIEEIERMHTEMQDIHDRFTERLEGTLTEMEEIREELGSKLGPMK